MFHVLSYNAIRDRNIQKAIPPSNQGCTKYTAIINDLGDKNSVFSARLRIQTWNNLKTTKKLVKCSLSTLIITCQPRVAFRLVSKVNGFSGAKGTVLFLIGRARPIAWSPRSPDVTHATSNYGDMWRTRYTNLLRRIPLASIAELIGHSQRR
jgi:hypothetical protein